MFMNAIVSLYHQTEHAGSGKLPTIIGGRDLEVFLGNKHKDIEDLFAFGVMVITYSSFCNVDCLDN